MIALSPEEYRISRALLEKGEARIRELIDASGQDQVQVTVAVGRWKTLGWLTEEVRLRTELIPVPGLPAELPERCFLKSFAGGESSIPLAQATARANAAGVVLSAIFRYGIKRGWFRKDKATASLLVTEAGQRARENPEPDEELLELARNRGALFLDSCEGIDTDRAAKLLRGRNEVARLKARKERIISLTAAGREELAAARESREVSELPSSLIVSEEWKNVRLKPYDVTLAAETPQAVKRHPLGKVLDEVRRVFLEMGFRETASPMVESAFWDFDALFQPQDHPAREMQDTFYMKNPPAAELPRDEYVDAVASVHENGGDTGSTGWGYRWSRKEARRTLLRTHTTAATIRALARDPNGPRKIFAVGRVFRNETISYKHLPEFHQVDGIIVDSRASFRQLLGTLVRFYQKMGFEKVKFRPDFFPYTEPSVEVSVFMDSRQEWIELGGAGIFRPEVTLPFGCTSPVLAWGLGLERLAMLRLGIDDIRKLYTADLDWLRESRTCL